MHELTGNFFEIGRLPIFAEAGAAEGGLASFLPMIGYLAFFGVVMYFLVFRPQKKKDKLAREMMDSLKVGSVVIAHCGIIGKIVNIQDDIVTIESSIERSQLDMKKWGIKEVQPPVQA